MIEVLWLMASHVGWLDGIYMGEIFYADYTQRFQSDNETAWGV
jgi:rhamnogalacturonyl hydrolase YesR